MSVRAHVLAQRAGVGVALVAAGHLADVGLLLLVRAHVLEAVAGVGVGLAAPFHRADVRLFPCAEKGKCPFRCNNVLGTMKSLNLRSVH